MNYYQITPDIDFEDDVSFTPSPSNSPISDEDDDPNWLILTSSKSKHSSSSDKLQKGHMDKNEASKFDNSVKGELYKTDKVDGGKNLNKVIDNSAQKIGLSSTTTQRPSCENNNGENGNAEHTKTPVVMMRKKNRDKTNLNLNLDNNHQLNTRVDDSHYTDTSLNNNGSSEDNIHGANYDRAASNSRNSNRFSRILDGVASYAVGYMHNIPKEVEEDETPSAELISDDNCNIFTQSLYGKLHDINVDSGYSDNYSDNCYNSFTRTYNLSEVPPLVLSDLSPEEQTCQEDAITKRIDELFDSLKPSATTDATQSNKKQEKQNSINNSVVRRRQKHGWDSAYSNHRKSFGEGLVDMSTRKLQTVSGYFGDWTKWLRTSEEGVTEEAEFYRKLNIGQRSTISCEKNTNCKGGNSMRCSSNISSKSVLNNAAVLHNERQKTSSCNKKG